MQGFPLREFYSSTVIFEEYSLGDSAYILKEGKVEISMKSEDGRVVLAELSPFSIFGEMALLSKEKRRTASAKALTHVKVIEIAKENFDKLLSDSPGIITAVLQGVTQRLADTTSRLHPGYVERREKQAPPPEGIDRRSASQALQYDRIKVQLVRSGQKISQQPLDSYREVRQATLTKTDGVRVEYFDGDIEWFQVNALVYVTGR